MPPRDRDRPQPDEGRTAARREAPAPPVTAEALRAFLARPETLARATRIVRRRAHPQDVSNLVHDAVVDALKARRRPSPASVQAWFDQVCRHVVGRHHGKRAARREHEGPMPVAAVRTDEAGEPLDDDDDPLDDVDPRHDPERDRSFHASALMLRRWLEEQTAGDERDRETFALMCEWADGDRTYADIAREHGLSLSSVNQRVAALKKKYAAQFERYREGMILLWIFGLGLALVLALLLALLLRRPHDDIRPDPGWEPARPAPSASAAPPDTPFEPAQPTPAPPPGPAVPDKPR